MPTSFAVYLPSLSEVPGMLDRVAEASRRCEEYAEDGYSAMDHGPGPLRNAEAGLINLISGTHNRIRGEVVGYFGDVRSFGTGQGDKVAESIDLYQRTDEELATTLDQTLWSIEVQAMQAEASELRLSSELDIERPEAVKLEPEDPVTALVPLTDYRAEMPFVPEWAGDDTLAGRGRDAIWQVTHVAADMGLLSRPYDVIAELVIPFTGDWAGMKSCGDALDNLTIGTGRLKANTFWTSRRVDAVWFGIVADACFLQVHRLGLSLRDAVPALEAYAKAYHDVVVKIRDLEHKAGEVLVEVLDWALVVVAAVLTPPVGVADFFNKIFDYFVPPTGVLEVVIRVLHLLDILSLATQAMWDFESQVELGMLHGRGVSAPMPTVPEPSSVNY
jgi:hypothetical protein